MIHLVTGGQRSGKSEYAEKLVLKRTENPVYLATSRIWDENHKKRIDNHKARRGKQWENIEEELNIGKFNFLNRVVLIDCITLWLNNLFFDYNNDVDIALELAKKEIDLLYKQNSEFIMVTNEIGLGGHPSNELAMKFTDLQGYVNQYIAQKAETVTMLISGIPLKVK